MHRIDSARQSAITQCALAAQVEVLTDAINEGEAMNQQFIGHLTNCPMFLCLQVLYGLNTYKRLKE